MKYIYRGIYWVMRMMDRILGAGELFPWPPEKLKEGQEINKEESRAHVNKTIGKANGLFFILMIVVLAAFLIGVGFNKMAGFGYASSLLVAIAVLVVGINIVSRIFE